MARKLRLRKIKQTSLRRLCQAYWSEWNRLNRCMVCPSVEWLITARLMHGLTPTIKHVNGRSQRCLHQLHPPPLSSLAQHPQQDRSNHQVHRIRPLYRPHHQMPLFHSINNIHPVSPPLLILNPILIPVRTVIRIRSPIIVIHRIPHSVKVAAMQVSLESNQGQHPNQLPTRMIMTPTHTLNMAMCNSRTAMK